MGVTHNVRGAITFLSLNLALGIWDVTTESLHGGDHGSDASSAGHGDHGDHAEAATSTASTSAGHIERFPDWMEPAAPFLYNVFGSALFLGAAFAITAALNNDRRGYYGLLVMSLITVVTNAPDIVWHIQIGDDLHAVVCIIATFMGLVASWYSWQALRESAPTRAPVGAET